MCNTTYHRIWLIILGKDCRAVLKKGVNRFGKIGVDLALSTNSRNIERERGGELSASLSLY